MRSLPLGLFLVLGVSCQGSETPSTSSQGGSNSGVSGASSGGSAGALAAGTAGVTALSGGSSGAGGSAPATGGSVGTGGAAAGGMAGGSSGAGANGLGGSSGTSGTSGSAGVAGANGSLGCAGTELLCEDFEDVADGMVPTGGAWKALDTSCQYQTGNFTMGVTGTLAKGGSKSLKVTNKHFAQCRLSGQFPVVDEFWVRAYSYWEAALDITNRETLDIDLTPGFRTADDPAVRFGYRSKSPCEEFAGPQVTIIGIAGGEATGCGSRPMPKGEWFCFEARVQQSSTLIVSTFINGEAMSYQSTGKPVSAAVSTETAIAQKLDHIRLGIFSTGEAKGSVYLDDIVVSTTRVGCAN